MDDSDNTEHLLPSEQKNLAAKPGHFATLATLRHETDFPLKKAIDEYHLDSINYALALAEVAKEICEVTHRNDAAGYRALLASDRLNRQRRDIKGDDIEGTFILMTVRDWILSGRAKRFLIRIGEFCKKVWHLVSLKRTAEPGRELRIGLETEATIEPSKWIKELHKFRKNLNLLCQKVGSKVDEFAAPQDTINYLRTYAAEGKQRMSPLYEENAKLRHQLESYKRINAALQIRRTIERLVNQIPAEGRYNTFSAKKKWEYLWGDIRKDAETNDKNPFYEVFKEAKGFEIEDIKRKGKALYSDMSLEIHGYEKKDFDYGHFDSATRRVTRVLRPKAELVDKDNIDVDWKEEIKKYPFRLEVEVEKTPTETSEESPGKKSAKFLGKCARKAERKAAARESLEKSPEELDPGEGASRDWAKSVDNLHEGVGPNIENVEP
jgi:hypothetical protein